MIELSFTSSIVMALGIGYIFTALYLLSHSNPEKSKPVTLPKVAVLIAMRNEKSTISKCLESFEHQNYPVHLFDVFLIDDRSKDNSVAISKPVIDRNENFNLISIQEDKDNLKGKMNALAQVLDTIDHDIVLITDADCQVPPGWISTYIEYFDEHTGMVGGLTVLESLPYMTSESSSLFGKIQTLDWIFIQTIASASTNANLPVSILGNNFGFRLQAYNDTGTFKKLGFSVTEDFALLQAMEDTNKWKIKYVLNPANTVYSKPVNNLFTFFKQRKRWIIGGRKMRLWGYFITALSFFAHVGMLAVFLTASWNLNSALGIGLITGIDYFILKRELGKLGLNKLKKYFILFEIFYIVYTIIFGIAFPFFKKVEWKERILTSL